MNETASDIEAFCRGTTGLTRISGKLLHNIKDRIVFVVYNVHDRNRGYVSRLKDRISMRVNDRIIRIHFCKDKLFHNIGNICFFGLHELLQLFLIFKAISVTCSDTIIRLYNNGISHFFNKLPASLHRIDQMISRGRNSHPRIILFHPGFIFDPRNIILLESACDVECCTKPCISFKPVFIIGLQPVNPAVFKNQKCNCAVYFFFILQTAHLIIFIQTVLQALTQFFIRLIPDSQHVQPVFFEFPAEHPVIFRKVRGNKQKIFHNITLFFSSYLNRS